MLPRALGNTWSFGVFDKSHPGEWQAREEK